jgi:hypothetical protein
VLSIVLVFFISVFFYDGLLVLSKVSENCKDAYGALVLVNNSIITAVGAWNRSGRCFVVLTF